MHLQIVGGTEHQAPGDADLMIVPTTIDESEKTFGATLGAIYKIYYIYWEMKDILFKIHIFFHKM